MKLYALSDPHGFFAPFRYALERAGFFEDEGEKRVVICGDLLDRGEESRELVDFALDLKEKGQLIYVAGNHESLFYSALQDIVKGGVYEIACGMSHHFRNGTWYTLLQLAEMEIREAVSQPNELVRRVRRSPFYTELLPYTVDYFETKNYVFCHGWIPTFEEGFSYNIKYRYDPDWREAPPDRWDLARWKNGMDLSCRHHINEPGKTVVCGHWHASYGHARLDHSGKEFGPGADFSPFCREGIIALDACTAASGRVNCIVIEDEEL